MLRLSRGVEYAMRGLIYFVSQPEERVIPLSEISESECIPKSFLVKIFQVLLKRGIVKSVRGLDGGFILAKSPRNINLLDIIEGIDGPLSAFYDCHRDSCKKEDNEICPIHNAYKEGIDKLSDVLRNHSIEEIART
ncbi:MAG: Rrf2 family transcriptional regulator [Nitrospinae bacterium]|nr:Rrf2 family transcriptional regulator [Nitrospinota bacterium]